MRIPSRALGLAAVLLMAAGSTTAAERIDIDQLRIPHETIVLSNGLTVLVHEDHSVPIVAVNLWYHVGSRNEKRGKTGFAHIFEHFFFNGSENYPHGFREAMDDLGANNRNGTTNNDRTNFFEDVPVSALERTLYLEADRMGFLYNYISQEMLERERGVVSNEKRQGENQPYGRVFSRISESIYPYSHPYSWSTIGSMEDLQAATLDDVREWYTTYYGPNNCVLSLAGDITPQKARTLVEKYFGAIPPGPPLARHRVWVPRLSGDIREEMVDRVPQARIYRVWHAPPWGDRELADLQLATEVLSGSKSARLDRRLVYEKELATSVGIYVDDGEIASAIYIILTVKPGVDPAAVEAEADAVLAEYLEGGPTQDELQRARTRIAASFIRGIERLGGFGGRSDILAENMTYGGDPDAYLQRFTWMNEAEPARVKETSRRWLGAHHYTMVVRPAADLKKDDSAHLDRKVLPGLGSPPEVTFPRVQTRQLSNGLKVMLLERHSVPMVNLTLAVDAGYASDPANGAGTSELALDMMEEGTKTRDAFAIADALDALGAEIATGNNLDLSFVSLRALKANLDGSLELFADVALEPSFPEEMVSLGRRRQLARIGQEKASPVGAVLRLAPRLLYGQGHPYGNPLTGSGTEQSVAAMTRGSLAAWHDAWFLPNNTTLVVAGDITMAELAPKLEHAFGEWKQGKAPVKSIGETGPGAAKPGTVYLIDKPDAPQSVIMAMHLSRRGGTPMDLAIETVMTDFGGMATSRLNRNLRLDKHWSYGVRGRLYDARGPRPFVVLAPVQTDKTKEAMTEVTKEIRDIAGARPIEGEEFESIKRNVVSRLPGRFETLRSLESAAEELISYGYPPAFYYDYAGNVRGLTEKDLSAAAEAFIHPDKVVWIVVGDLDKVEAGIRELGYGEIVHLDPDGNPIGG